MQPREKTISIDRNIYYIPPHRALLELTMTTRSIAALLLFTAACTEAKGEHAAEAAPPVRIPAVTATATAAPAAAPPDDDLRPVKGEKLPWTMRFPAGGEQSTYSQGDYIETKGSDGVSCSIYRSSSRGMPKTAAEAAPRLQPQGYVQPALWVEELPRGGWMVATARGKGALKSMPERAVMGLRVDAKGAIHIVCLGSTASEPLLRKVVGSFQLGS
jgi:hypothetical protein